ncbi:hypothetical protein Sgly_3226 [Syntrophobotulus glycolicus DSM 8271]|uniref:Uncharacterized protein n=1 Tax=Syntrophobotulus glycolicus (strain DSM 8271 / FlGlyR) TaxID=645991 RepID=F0T1R6_SYNGF|nr:hypothetical protein Sgly_3226 [Syntrophobotulus glycolicus DSM 8271]
MKHLFLYIFEQYDKIIEFIVVSGEKSHLDQGER